MVINVLLKHICCFSPIHLPSVFFWYLWRNYYIYWSYNYHHLYGGCNDTFSLFWRFSSPRVHVLQRTYDQDSDIFCERAANSLYISIHIVADCYHEAILVTKGLTKKLLNFLLLLSLLLPFINKVVYMPLTVVIINTAIS